MRIIIESVVELSPVQLKKVSVLLQSKYGDDSKIEHILNPDILGGIRITAGSTRIDLSLIGRLDQIKKQIEV